VLCPGLYPKVSEYLVDEACTAGNRIIDPDIDLLP
jgi:hypothetical protein